MKWYRDSSALFAFFWIVVATVTILTAISIVE